MTSLFGPALVLGLTVLQPPPSGGSVYKQALPSVVWIQSPRTGGSATGSGSVIDRPRKLVLTNYHVVEDNPRATVFFPAFRDGQAVPEKTYYRDRAGRLGIPARVVVVNKPADLAILELARLPEGVEGLPLAAVPPGPGDTVHSIGNAGRSGALWGYVRGTVRQVYNKKWAAELSSRRKQAFDAKVIETDSPTNPGDSGGPLLNDSGELVGVTQGGALNAQSVSYFIDLSEVRKTLAKREVEAIRKPAPRTPPEPEVIVVSDGAELLSADAVTKANAVLAKLQRAKRPIRVETLAAAPEELSDALADANPAERKKAFERYAYERLEATGTDGGIILVCMKPSTAVVVLTNNASKLNPPGTTGKAAEALLDALKRRAYDSAVLEALKVFEDAMPDPVTDPKK